MEQIEKRLKIGMPALIEAPSIKESIALATELGFDFIEINSNLPIYQADQIDIERTKAMLEESGLFLTLHLEEYLHLTDLNPRISKLFQDILLGEIELAKKLSIPTLTLHLLNGVRYTLPERRVYVFEAYSQQFLQGVRDLRQACEEAIGDSGIRICIENLDGYIPIVVEAIGAFLESPAFGVTWDVGHDHCHNGADRPWIFRHSERVKHMHIHDASLKNDHLTLGSGDIDLGARFAFAREQKSSCLIEVKTAESLRQSAAYLQQHPEWWTLR